MYCFVFSSFEPIQRRRTLEVLKIYFSLCVLSPFYFLYLSAGSSAKSTITDAVLMEVSEDNFPYFLVYPALVTHLQVNGSSRCF